MASEKMIQIEVPEELEDLKEIFSSKNFSNWVKEKQNSKSKEKKYGDIVYKECHNSVIWMLRELKNNFVPLNDFVVVLGLWKDKDHSWLRFKDYYFDLTMRQFVNNCDELFVSKEKDAKENFYSPILEFKASSRTELEMYLNRVGIDK